MSAHCLSAARVHCSLAWCPNPNQPHENDQEIRQCKNRKERTSGNNNSRKSSSEQTHTDPNRANNARKDIIDQSTIIQRKTRHHQAHSRNPRQTDTPEHNLGELGPKRPLSEPLNKQRSRVEFYPTSGQKRHEAVSTPPHSPHPRGQKSLIDAPKAPFPVHLRPA